MAAAPALLELVGAGERERMVQVALLGYPDPAAAQPVSRRTPGATYTTWLDDELRLIKPSGIGMRRTISYLLMLTSLGLAACGAPAAQPSAVPPTPAVAAQPSAAPPTSEAPVTIKHLKGELTLDKPAIRIVACSDEMVDLVLALEIQPVGIYSARAQNDQLGAVFQPEAYFFKPEQYGSPVFVGSSIEPSLEQIVKLKPNIHNHEQQLQDQVYDKLAQIAATLYIDYRKVILLARNTGRHRSGGEPRGPSCAISPGV